MIAASSIATAPPRLCPMITTAPISSSASVAWIASVASASPPRTEGARARPVVEDHPAAGIGLKALDQSGKEAFDRLGTTREQQHRGSGVAKHLTHAAILFGRRLACEPVGGCGAEDAGAEASAASYPCVP